MGSALQKMGSRGKAAITKIDTTSKKLIGTLRRGAATADRMRMRLNALGGTSGMIGGLTRQLMGFASIFLIFSQGADSLKKFDEQAKSDIQIKAALVSTNNAAGRSFAQLATQADQLQKKTLFGDEETQRAQALMLTFKNVRTEMFDKTIPVIQDVATAMKMDLKSASLQVGKALNDPATGLSMLTRVGITFNEEQKELIKGHQKAGNVAAAQAIILEELKSQFGGSAEAAAQAGTGAFKQFGNRMGDIKESIGGIIFALGVQLMPVFNGFASMLENTIGWMREHKAAVKGVATILGTAALAMTSVIIVTKIWTGVQWLLNAAMMANPIGIVIAAVAALVGAIIWAWNTFEGFRKFLFGMWDSFKAVFTNLKSLAFDVLGGIGQMLIGVFTFDIDMIKAGFGKLSSGFKDYGSSIAKAYQDGADKGAASWEKSQEKKAQAKGSALGAFGSAGGGLGTDATGDASGGLGLGLSGVSGGGKSTRNITIRIENLVNEINNNFTSVEHGIQDVAEQVKQALLTAVNDANLAGQ